MKVVLFCGGLGMRMREYSETIPKPMVPVGPRPILWHVMKYYAHFGHTEFILCLGHQGAVIKDYFLRYDECISNDFVLSCGSRQIHLANRDLEDWTITFVDTGLHVSIGERLRCVRPYLEGEEMFLANYSDNLSDLPLSEMVEWFRNQPATGMFVSVRPGHTFHLVSIEDEHRVAGIQPVEASDIWINGGYFVFRPDIFDYMRPGEELVIEPFRRLIAEEKLVTRRYTGFWMCMDTFKDRQMLEDMHARGDAPWELWRPVDDRRGNGRAQSGNGNGEPIAKGGRPCSV